MPSSTLPDFLGIGALRAGTRWLRHLLVSHPDVYVPPQRDELHFFDLHHDRGQDWYGQFFPTREEAAKYKRIGEIASTYLEGECAERIKRMGTVDRLIVRLRNPVDWLYSWYGYTVREMATRESFETFLSHVPYAEPGFLPRELEKYLQRFSREQLLVLVFEESVKNVEETKRRVAEFLDIDPALFPEEAGQQRENASYVPRFHRAYVLASRTAEWLREHDLDAVVEWGKRLGIRKEAFGNAGSLPPLDNETRARVWPRYREDIDRLEDLLAVDLSAWRARSPAESEAESGPSSGLQGPSQR